MGTLRRFAARHRLRVRRDADGSPVVRGRTVQSRPGQRKIATYGGGLLMLTVTNLPSRRHWTNIRRRCEAAGMRLHQDGDEEGGLLCDPADRKQARAAIRECGARPKRRPSPAQLAALEKARAVSPVGGQTVCAERTTAPRTVDRPPGLPLDPGDGP